MKRLADLQSYRQKRDFARTPEPPGRTRAPSPAPSFCVQEHHASHLHFDFRLEMGGVLKSWAVPKGPCVDPDVSRLAVQVEDHPLEYGRFEGRIPEGQYGAGRVILWDRGTWAPESDPAKAYRSGKLVFRLEGEKLRGRWSLIRLRASERAGGKANWLLRKLKDEAARPLSDVDILRARPGSVREDAAAAPDEPIGRKAPFPSFIEPELATFVDQAPLGDEWVHEIKFDGYRFLAFIDRGRARLKTRNGREWSSRLPHLCQRLAKSLRVTSAVLDGELVALNEAGVSDFAALKDALGRADERLLLYYAFDLLYLDGRDLRDLPLGDRKKALRALVENAKLPSLSYSDHIEGRGQLVFRRSCEYALEGTVSKRKDAPYRSGRQTDWVKIKCQKRQEFVVAGYTDPRGSRQGLGALLLGVHEGGRLLYAGKVGTGFSSGFLKDLRRKLGALGRPESPFASAVPRSVSRGAHWVEPRLVAEVLFSNWTRDHRLRHPSFLGLREDKPPAQIVREVPAAAPRKAPSVRLTHPERWMYPEAELTKADLAHYYEQLAPRILPHVAGRLLSLVRCPDGAGKPCFYQKRAFEGAPASLKSAEGGVYIEDEAGLRTLAQYGVLEIHPWGSRLKDLEHPDRCTFDLDPGPGVAWPAVVRAAREVRNELKGRGLESFVKTSGGKGLHVVVPMEPGPTWDEIKAFSRRVAEELSKRYPDRYTATMSKSARPGRIFIDYLRNGRGATAVAAYSPRARTGATVSLPLAWEELTTSLSPDLFTIRTVPTRLKRIRKDPWRRFFMVRQSLPKPD